MAVTKPQRDHFLSNKSLRLWVFWAQMSQKHLTEVIRVHCYLQQPAACLALWALWRQLLTECCAQSSSAMQCGPLQFLATTNIMWQTVVPWWRLMVTLNSRSNQHSHHQKTLRYYKNKPQSTSILGPRKESKADTSHTAKMPSFSFTTTRWNPKAWSKGEKSLLSLFWHRCFSESLLISRGKTGKK